MERGDRTPLFDTGGDAPTPLSNYETIGGKLPVAIGVLPDRRDKLVKIGNCALTGARQMLLSHERREDAERIAPRIKHVKLSEQEDFLDRYIHELYLRCWP